MLALPARGLVGSVIIVRVRVNVPSSFELVCSTDAININWCQTEDVTDRERRAHLTPFRRRTFTHGDDFYYLDFTIKLTRVEP